MKKLRKIGLVLLLMITASCSKDDVKDKLNTGKEQIVTLNDETIKGLEKVYLIGTPLRLDNGITMKDVEKEWGKPDEVHDHEDIQTYVYLIQNQRIIISEDELSTIYTFMAELETTKEEILDLLGKPTEQSGQILVYKGKVYSIVFEKLGDHWYVILRRT